MSRLCLSRFPKIAGAAISADMTIRSYGTYQKILALMQPDRS
jgi:hypothetical protein